MRSIPLTSGNDYFSTIDNRKDYVRVSLFVVCGSVQVDIMRIGTRLTLILLAVALIPLVLSAILTVVLSTETITAEILNHLESVATIQSHRIQQSISQNYDKLNLIISRTSLLPELDIFLSDRKMIPQCEC